MQFYIVDGACFKGGGPTPIHVTSLKRRLANSNLDFSCQSSGQLKIKINQACMTFSCRSHCVLDVWQADKANTCIFLGSHLANWNLYRPIWHCHVASYWMIDGPIHANYSKCIAYKMSPCEGLLLSFQAGMGQLELICKDSAFPSHLAAIHPASYQLCRAIW